jgi:hypothetical protein
MDVEHAGHWMDGDVGVPTTESARFSLLAGTSPATLSSLLEMNAEHLGTGQ